METYGVDIQTGAGLYISDYLDAISPFVILAKTMHNSDMVSIYF